MPYTVRQRQESEREDSWVGHTLAADLADSSGLSAISMRRVAAALGVEAMSLYHHLPGKEGLLDGLAEQVVVEIQEELGDGQGAEHDDWRAELRHRCLTARKVMLRHPWAPVS